MLFNHFSFPISDTGFELRTITMINRPTATAENVLNLRTCRNFRVRFSGDFVRGRLRVMCKISSTFFSMRRSRVSRRISVTHLHESITFLNLYETQYIISFSFDFWKTFFWQASPFSTSTSMSSNWTSKGDLKRFFSTATRKPPKRNYSIRHLMTLSYLIYCPAVMSYHSDACDDAIPQLKHRGCLLVPLLRYCFCYFKFN